MSPPPLEKAPEVELPTGSPCTPGTYIYFVSIVHIHSSKMICMTFGHKVFFKEKNQPSQAGFLIHQPPPTHCQASTIHPQNHSQETVPYNPTAWFPLATLMHNLLTYTIPVNSGLTFSRISEFEGFIKIWIQIKGL